MNGHWIRLIKLLVIIVQLKANPSLLDISRQNDCIKETVEQFIVGSSCQSLTQNGKSELALKMTDCLLEQMNKPGLKCKRIEDCRLSGDQWNTFSTFFAHIDNLCHFYWDVAKAERTEELTAALMRSAQKTHDTLEKNTENTNQILTLQQSLREQILKSITNQEIMSQLLNSSSSTITSLTANLSDSLTKIHSDIDSHYAVVSRILATLDHVVNSLQSMQGYLMASASSMEGVTFFFIQLAMIVLGCLVSERVKLRLKESLIVATGSFLLEYLGSEWLSFILDVQKLRMGVLLVFLFLFLTAQPMTKDKISPALSSARIERLIQQAMRRNRDALEGRS